MKAKRFTLYLTLTIFLFCASFQVTLCSSIIDSHHQLDTIPPKTWTDKSPSSKLAKCITNSELVITDVVQATDSYLRLAPNIGDLKLFNKITDQDINLTPSWKYLGYTENEKIFISLATLNYEDLCISTLLHYFEAKIMDSKHGKRLEDDLKEQIITKYENFPTIDSVSNDTKFIQREVITRLPNNLEIRQKIKGYNLEQYLQSKEITTLKQNRMLRIRDEVQRNIQILSERS